MPLVIGSYFRLCNADGSPAFGLILLAQNREGYGNLSELITLARTRAPKGKYRLTPHDLSRPDRDNAHLRGMPDCLAILVPDFPAKEEALDVQTRMARRNLSRTGRGSASCCISGRWTTFIAARSSTLLAQQNVPVVALG